MKEKNTQKKKAEKGEIHRDRCGGEGGLERDMVEKLKKKNMGKLIVKYEIVLQRAGIE